MCMFTVYGWINEKSFLVSVFGISRIRTFNVRAFGLFGGSLVRQFVISTKCRSKMVMVSSKCAHFLVKTIIKLSEWPNDTWKHPTCPLNCSFYRAVCSTMCELTTTTTAAKVALLSSYNQPKIEREKKEKQNLHTIKFTSTKHVYVEIVFIASIFYGGRTTIRDNFTLGFSVYFHSVGWYIVLCWICPCIWSL